MLLVNISILCSIGRQTVLDKMVKYRIQGTVCCPKYSKKCVKSFHNPTVWGTIVWGSNSPKTGERVKREGPPTFYFLHKVYKIVSSEQKTTFVKICMQQLRDQNSCTEGGHWAPLHSGHIVTLQYFFTWP